MNQPFLMILQQLHQPGPLHPHLSCAPSLLSIFPFQSDFVLGWSNTSLIAKMLKNVEEAEIQSTGVPYVEAPEIFEIRSQWSIKKYVRTHLYRKQQY